MVSILTGTILVFELVSKVPKRSRSPPGPQAHVLCSIRDVGAARRIQLNILHGCKAKPFSVRYLHDDRSVSDGDTNHGGLDICIANTHIGDSGK